MPEPVRRHRPSLVPGEDLVEDRLGYVFDVLAPRDTWMHRVDVATATARATEQNTVTTQVEADEAADLLDADRAVVAQVVRELALAGPRQPSTGPAPSAGRR